MIKLECTKKALLSWMCCLITRGAAHSISEQAGKKTLVPMVLKPNKLKGVVLSCFRIDDLVSQAVNEVCAHLVQALIYNYQWSRTYNVTASWQKSTSSLSFKTKQIRKN